MILKKPHRIIQSVAVFTMLAIAAFLNSCGTTTSTYSTPTWATGISDGTNPYYYFPDYNMYYDAGSGQYYYLNNGAWLSSEAVPYPNVDLNRSYVVELNRGTTRPWMNDDFYRRNYPAHEQEEYTRIAREQNLVPRIPQDHVVMPRAYNENTQRMIFEERQQARENEGPGTRIATHEVPMRQISPNMPAQARQYRYGGDERGR